MNFIKSLSTRRFTVSDVSNNRFYQLPKFLFEGELHETLNNDAKILYSILKDRHSLSVKHNWINERGEVFFVYTRTEMDEMLGCSSKTTRKAINQLKEVGLLEEEHLGLNKANRLYLMALNAEITGPGNIPGPERESFPVRTGKKYQSGEGNIPSQDGEIFPLNNTEYNKTDLNETESIYLSDGLMEEQTRSDVEENNGIPEVYYGNPEKLSAAIKVICDAEYMRAEDSRDLFTPEEITAYDRIIQAMIDMSTANRNMSLNGSIVTYRQFISLLNSYFQGCGCDPAKMYQSVLHMSTALLSAIKTYQPQNLSAYTKSFVWQRLSDMPIRRHTEQVDDR